MFNRGQHLPTTFVRLLSLILTLIVLSSSALPLKDGGRLALESECRRGVEGSVQTRLMMPIAMSEACRF